MRTLTLMLLTLAVACEDPAGTDPVDTGDADTTDVEEDTTDGDSEAVGDEGMTASDLLFMREEEKLARDVYQVLYDDTGMQVFGNIRDSEQRHMDALLPHIERLGLSDPIVDDTTGVFVDPVLVELYDDLIAQGSVDLIGALTVGATIEDLDIVDLTNAIEANDDAAIAATYESLMCGSRNHLRAFMRQLGNQGGDYTPQFMTQEDFDAVVSTSNEQCG